MERSPEKDFIVIPKAFRSRIENGVFDWHLEIVRMGRHMMEWMTSSIVILQDLGLAEDIFIR